MIKTRIKLEYEIQRCELEIEQAKREFKRTREVLNQLIKESEEFARASFEVR